MYSVIRKARQFDLPIYIQMELFNTMVLPLLTYGSEVSRLYIVRELELLHLKFLKHLLFVHKNISNYTVYGELGAYPLSIHIKCRMLCYSSRMISGKQFKLCYVMYQCLFYLDRIGLYTSPWVAYVKKLLNDNGMLEIWLAQNVPNLMWFKGAVERRLKDQWITMWYYNLSTKSLCRNYRAFKCIYGLEEYLSKMPKSSRILITRFRNSSNKLPINVGRCTGVNREEWVFNKCNANVIRYEFYVILECTNEEILRLREMYISSYYTLRPTYLKYAALMQNSRIEISKNLVLFFRSIAGLFR